MLYTTNYDNKRFLLKEQSVYYFKANVVITWMFYFMYWPKTHQHQEHVYKDQDCDYV